MKRIAATTLVAMSVLHAGGPSSAQTPQTDAAAAQSDADAAMKAAGEQARAEAARRLGFDASELTIVSVEPTQWSDSSLGCRRPGMMYQQVITDGYSVVLERQGKQHRVNVAGSRAVICDTRLRSGAGARQPMPARGLDQMTTLARQDLAARLKVNAHDIRVVRMEPQRWTDRDMSCGATTVSPTKTATMGYRILLAVAERTYVYHTDMKVVRPCPPIEDQ